MEYVSLKNPAKTFTFKEAVTQSIAPDGSLFVPEYVFKFDTDFIRKQNQFNLKDTAYFLLSNFISEDLDVPEFNEVIAHTFQFDFPIVQLRGSDLFVEELFHGPTHAFKDVGARFLAGCLKQWRKEDEQITVLVATSGDTGGAVANAFYAIQGINVVVLYPKGKISSYQEQQIAGLGKNIKAVAVNGNFDDCQQLVKRAFSDKTISDKIQLTSANSINIGRWLPQMMFYATAWHHMEKNNLEKTIVVPSGNYGNISAGLLFHKIGFQFGNIVAAHNQNDTIPRYFNTYQYAPQPTIATFANAMDVSDPSNFVRFQYLKNIGTENTFQFSAISVNDQDILKAIAECWEKYQYLLDPHTATAYHVLNQKGGRGMILSTAHPYKFKEIIIKALGFYPDAWNLEERERKIFPVEMEVDFEALREILLQP